MNNNYFIAGGLLVFLAAAGIFGLSGSNAGDNSGLTGNMISDSPELESDPGKVAVYFFWGEGCPHCAHEKPFLEEMHQKYPEIELKMFETWHNQENAKLFQQVAEAYGTTARGVPTTFIGDKHWVGYADYMGEEIESQIKYCIDNGCVNPGDKL